MKKINNLVLLGVLFVVVLISPSCKKDDTTGVSSLVTEVLPKLSDYKMFQGTYTDLKPSNGYVVYDESSALFTDSCEKQRLIMIPTGTKMTVTNSGMPVFPEGTVLAKTFYYLNDKRDPASKKHILETRVLIYTKSKWIGGTYAWNDAQTDGVRLKIGASVPVSWKDETGKSHAINFLIAKDADCFTCHKSDGEIVPIGPQVKFWNQNVVRDTKTVNQLIYFQSIGIMNPIDPTLLATFVKVPDYNDVNSSLQVRARSYLDANCAYCHSATGFAATKSLRLNYELDLDKTDIVAKKNLILSRMGKGSMPLIPSATINQEAIALLSQYFATLPN